MIYFTTIALDAMPYLATHLPVFNRLRVPWKWIVIEGVAENIKCTQWCNRIEPRLSIDGTHEYLQQIASHPNVLIECRESWPGKVSMFNAALRHCRKPGILWQIDADELYTAEMFEKMYQAFQAQPRKNAARFHARYFLGQNICITSNGTYGNRNGEWLRAWRFQPGMQWITHEPPNLQPMALNAFSVKETLAIGIEMSHYAYATADQVAFKEKYYNYPKALEQWTRLQQNTQWPCRAKDFLPWIDDETTCDRLFK